MATCGADSVPVLRGGQLWSPPPGVLRKLLPLPQSPTPGEGKKEWGRGGWVGGVENSVSAYLELQTKTAQSCSTSGTVPTPKAINFKADYSGL